MTTSNWTIRQRLVVIVISISLVIVGAVALIAVSAYAGVLRQQTQTAFINANQLFANAIDARLQDSMSTARTFAAALSDQASSPLTSGWQLASNLLTDHYRAAQRISVYARLKGGHQTIIYNPPYQTTLRVARVKQYVDNTLPVNAWFLQTLRDGQPRWHELDRPFDPDAFEPVVSYAVPYRAANGVYAGVVWVDIAASDVQSWLSWMNERPAGYTLLFNNDGQLIASLNTPESTDLNQTVQDFLRQPDIAPLWKNVDSTWGVFHLAADPLDANAPSVVLMNRLSQSGWQMMTVLPTTSLQNPLLQSLGLIALITLLGIGTLAAVIYNFLGRSLSEPLGVLGKAAREIGSGDMRYQIDYQSRPDEIGQLAGAMEDMKRHLSYSYQQLAMSRDLLEKRVQQRTQELQETQKLAQQKADELQAVYDASLSVVGDHQLDVILERLMTSLLSLLKGHYASVWLLTSSKRHLQMVASTGNKALLNMLIDHDAGLVGKATQEGRLVRVEDYLRWPDRLEAFAEEVGASRVMVVPLTFYNRSIGAVVVGRKVSAPDFTPAEERLLTLFGNLVSPVVRNAQLFIQREEATRAAERASSVKTRFLASVTHELRTPLNLIINNMDFMRIGMFGDVNADQRGRLDQTIRSAEHLLSLINDLLDTSKIEAGEMELTVMPGDLMPVLEDAMDSALMLLEGAKSSVTLEAHIPSDLPHVPMDARRVRQVLTNLLSNAVKFTTEGSINLTVVNQGDQIVISVRDTGMGIAPEDMDRLFQPFQRAERAKHLDIEGTGLGLTITRYLIEAHGGKLTVESAPGKGSTFTFTLPLNNRQLKRPITKPITMAIGVE